MLAIALAGCNAARPYAVLTSPQEKSTFNDASYRLAVNNRVKIIVFNEQSLTGEFIVNASGNISLPLIGEIKALALTADELGAAITAKLSDGYLQNPKVAVEVQSFQPVYVLGEVNHAGRFDYVQGMTVLQAIASAEGFSYRANKRVVLIKHPDGVQETTTQITPDLKVRPGDTIRVIERYF
jgi:protein involved in polysaccharide export with SLBB domain